MLQLLEVQKHKEKTFQRDLLPFFAKEAQPIWMVKKLLRLNVQVHVIAHYT